MTRKPNYLGKPANFYATKTGFMHSGEGMVVGHKKGNKITGDRIYYFLLFRGDITKFAERSVSLTPNQARKNIEVKDDFSTNFKRDLLCLSFETKKSAYITNIRRFARHLERK